MKVSTSLLFLVFIFFLIPYLPRNIISLTDFLAVRILLLVTLVAAVQKDALLGIFYFLVIANLFIQRNSQKLLQFEARSDVDSEAVQSIQSSPNVPEQPAFEQPSVKSIPFMPQEDSGDDSFHAIAESINEKHVLPTETVDGSQKAIHQLFQWVNPSLAQD